MAGQRMSKEELKARTKAFGLRIIRLVERLPRSRAADVMGRQLLRCGTSVGANYRAACRARSPAEFCAKLGIVEEEADEAIYWMELFIGASLVRPDLLSGLLAEANELLAIIISSIKTARQAGRPEPARRNESLAAIRNPQSAI